MNRDISWANLIDQTKTYPKPYPETALTQFSIIVPICNGIDQIKSLLHTLTQLSTEHQDHDHEIIFVNIGSQGGTLTEIQDWPHHDHIRVIEHPADTDRMTSIRTGIANAQSHVIVLMMDTHSSPASESIMKLVNPILAGSCDMTIGRDSNTDSSAHRSPMTRFTAWLARSICDTQDPTSGLFAFRSTWLKWSTNWIGLLKPSFGRKEENPP